MFLGVFLNKTPLFEGHFEWNPTQKSILKNRTPGLLSSGYGIQLCQRKFFKPPLNLSPPLLFAFFFQSLGPLCSSGVQTGSFSESRPIVFWWCGDWKHVEGMHQEEDEEGKTNVP